MEPSFDKITRSKLYEIGSVLWDIVALSLIWLIFSIPIITSGASSAALYFALYKRVKKESDAAIPDFMRSFKSNIRQSIPLSLLYTIFAVIIVINIHIARFGLNGIMLPAWYLPFAILIIVPFVILYPFAYPYLARFSTDTKHIIMNSAAISSMNFGKAFLLFIISFVSITLMVLFPPCVLIVPFVASYLRVMVAEKIFEAAIEQEKHRTEASEDEEGEAE